ncbi:MAG TPA: GntR family transcriptional regulator [Candidatus Binatia bacterium]|nr:GntR family transcriptional regulator [Candidatus Binatia bacterium]
MHLNEIAASRRSDSSLTPAALGQLLEPWLHGKGPLRARLKDAVEKAILEGLIADGTRLPSERGFADAGGVSRSTIVSAYDMLEEDGLIERRRGSEIVRTETDVIRRLQRRHRNIVLNAIKANIDVICVVQDIGARRQPARNARGDVEKIRTQLSLLPGPTVEGSRFESVRNWLHLKTRLVGYGCCYGNRYHTDRSTQGRDMYCGRAY